MTIGKKGADFWPGVMYIAMALLIAPYFALEICMNRTRAVTKAEHGFELKEFPPLELGVVGAVGMFIDGLLILIAIGFGIGPALLMGVLLRLLVSFRADRMIRGVIHFRS